jgi:Uma2 family endonuclease
LVEIADSSYVKDRGPKWQKYAASGIPEYWLLNCPLRRLEIFTQPTGKGRKAAYESSIHYEQNDAVPVVLSGQEVGRLKLSDVLA